MSLPRDLRRRHPRPRAPEAQRRLRLRRGPPDAAHRPRPARGSRSTTTCGSPSGASAARSTASAASTSTSTTSTSTTTARPTAAAGPTRSINVGAGYQRLCGEDALSYVRYRHLDNDLIRAARQQSFLGEAKNQIGIGSVFSDRKELLRIFGQSVRTDIDSSNAILSLLRLVAESADKPIQEVQFPAQDAGDGSGNVVIGATALKRTVESFLAARATTGPRGTAKSTTAKRSKRSRKRQSNAVAWPGPQPQREREHRRAAAGQARPPAGLLPDADVCDRQLPGRRLARLRHRRPCQQAPPRLPDRRLRRPDRPVLRQSRAPIGARPRSSTTRARA